MKKIMILLFVLVISTAALAQGKQQRVMIQQIAALKVYIDYAKKGYEVARKGLKVIGDFKDGEFRLHSDYFTSLGLVSPMVRNYIRVAQTVSLELRILEAESQLTSLVQSATFISAGERSYIEGVIERLDEDCELRIDALTTLTGDGNLELTDKQRLERIDAVYAAMEDNYAFIRHFSDEVSLLLHSRVREGNDIQRQRTEYNLN